MFILADDTAAMVAIVAGLVREGVTFEAHEINGGRWRIELTGGF